MIVKRIWIKKRRDIFGHIDKITSWEGWFLFGFIPLYIRQTGTRTIV